MSDVTSEKTIKGILTKLGLIMVFILIVPGIMINVFEIDIQDGCITLSKADAIYFGTSFIEKTCWKDLGADKFKEKTGDKTIQAKITFDRDVVGLLSWGLTIFIFIMVVVGFVFPGRDIIAYIKQGGI